MSCSCKTDMVSYRRDKFFTHCDILVGFHCLIVEIEFSLATTYFVLCCFIWPLVVLSRPLLLILDLIALAQFSLLYSGYYCLILLLSWLLLPSSLWSFSYIFYEKLWLWCLLVEFGFILLPCMLEFGFLITILGHGTWILLSTFILELGNVVSCLYWGIRHSYRFI